jgi:proteasome component ECM29
LKQLKEHGDSKALRIVDAGYIRTGLARISNQEELFEILRDGILHDISKHLSPPSPTGSILLYFLLQTLPRIQLPRRGDPENLEYRVKLGISNDDAKSLVIWFGKVLLLRYETHGRERHANYLSAADTEFLGVPELSQAWSTETPETVTVSKAKYTILDFMETGAFSEREKLLTYLFVGPETNPTGVSDRGANYIKSIKIQGDKDSKEFVEELYKVYFGEVGSSGAAGSSPQMPLTFKTRALTLLTKSHMLAKFTAEASRVLHDALRDGLEGKSSGIVGQRFNSAFVAFVIHTFRVMDAEFRNSVATSLIQSLKEFIISGQGWPKADSSADLEIRGQIYRLIGLAAQEGHILDLDLLEFLYSSLNDDDSGRETMLFIEEAISSFTQAFAKEPLGMNTMKDLESWLLMSAKGLNRPSALGRVHKSAPFILSRIANRCLPYNSIIARYVNFLVFSKSQQTFEAKEEASIGLNPFLFRTHNSHRPDLWYKLTKVDELKLQEPDSCDFLWPNWTDLAEALFPEIEVQNFQVFSEHDTLETIRSHWSSSHTAYVMGLRYLHRVYLMCSISSIAGNSGKMLITESWETQMDLSLEQPIWKTKGYTCHYTESSTLLTLK